ncbi:WGR domain-containing protein [Sinorhizobium meliloti]|uniref:WGR domain-containing protein n=1 Tax=Rhizobium meliloti TaxID=382 RepID=UPI003A7F2DCD
MARFYTLAIEPTLFGTPCLIRRWGASGHGASLRQGRGCSAHDPRSAADQTGARLKTETRVRREHMAWGFPQRARPDPRR